jgi:hypothetical protein
MDQYLSLSESSPLARVTPLLAELRDVFTPHVQRQKVSPFEEILQCTQRLHLDLIGQVTCIGITNQDDCRILPQRRLDQSLQARRRRIKSNQYNFAG